jgi:hypothetical protein
VKPASTGSFDRDVSDLLGAARFTGREYAAAVVDGNVVDQVEYDEARLIGLRNAEKAYKAAAAELDKRDSKAAIAIARALESLRKAIDGIAPVAEVDGHVKSIASALEPHLAGGVSPNLRATVASVMACDADLKGEKAVDGYRIGVATFAPREYGRYEGPGAWVPRKPEAGETHYLAICVREAGTKRGLPASKVTATVNGTAWEMQETWGDYLLYGRNVALPEGAFTLKVDVEPPQICRHADALALDKPASAVFAGTRKGAEVTIDAPPPGPTIADYVIGQDVEQAIAEPIERTEQGDYAMGFIAEGPEPFWVWKGDRLEGRETADADTHHLEIALLERGTNRIVTGAAVKLSLKNKETGAVQDVEMHNLLSEFAHYGQTLRVAPAVYIVTATVAPPKVALFAPGRFEKTETWTFEWDGRPQKE